MTIDGFDTRGVTDNRNYDYSACPELERAEYNVITSWVTPGSRVLDLACGNGSLLEKLTRERNISGTGVEISPSGIEQCRRKGLAVRIGRIDVPLREFADDMFDIVICNVSLQMVSYPEITMKEMHRLAPESIISFPNFAFFPNRLELLLSGRMPRRMLYGYFWYDTGHIHQFSLRDFLELSDQLGFRIARTCWRAKGGFGLRSLARLAPNAFSSIPIVHLARG